MAEEDLEGRDWREISRLVGVIVVVLLLVGFVADNRESVPVGFIFWEGTAPLFLVLFATAALGVALGALVRRIRRR